MVPEIIPIFMPDEDPDFVSPVVNGISLLPKKYKGRGETKDFMFTRLEEHEMYYMYQVDAYHDKSEENTQHFEVFKRKINTQFMQESKPGAESFGIWAWTFKKHQDAITKFKQLVEQHEAGNKL